MTLHAKNLAVFAGAIGETAIKIANQMSHEGRVRFDRAKELIKHFMIKERCEDPEHKDAPECKDPEMLKLLDEDKEN